QRLEIGNACRALAVVRRCDQWRERRDCDDPQARAHRGAGDLANSHASSPGNVAPLCHTGPRPTRKQRILCRLSRSSSASVGILCNFACGTGLYLNTRLILHRGSEMSTSAHVPRRRRPRLRSRGRPPVDADSDVRSALLDAASRVFLKHGFERVTARQIAVAADTTPAMIHYYFGNKLGLFRAMLERAIGPVRELIAGSLSQAGAVVDPAVLIRMHMRTAAANPWIATLIVNEVLAEKGRF